MPPHGHSANHSPTSSSSSPAPPATSHTSTTRPSPLQHSSSTNSASQADTSNPASPRRGLLKRSSISWHPSADSSLLLERKRSITMAHADESSADEHTAILDRPRGGPRDYNTTTTSSNGAATAPGVDAAPSDDLAAPDASPFFVGATGRRASGASRRRRSPMPPRRTGSRPMASPEDPSDLPWWRSFVSKYGTVELENKGSVARDHLALERTFLAWLRTSLSFASIGIAVTQLFRLNTTLRGGKGDNDGSIHLRQVGKPLGATFLAIAIVVLIVGFHRYFESQHYIILGRFPASRGSIFLITFVAGALIVASFVVILTVAPQAID